MSTIELNAKAATYFDLLAQIEELTAEAEAIKDVLKGVMVERATEELDGDGWRATWHNTTTSRFDSKRFKADYRPNGSTWCWSVGRAATNPSSTR